MGGGESPLSYLYIASTGTDNNDCGADASPCKTISGAMSRVQSNPAGLAENLSAFYLDTSQAAEGSPTTFTSNMNISPYDYSVTKPINSLQSSIFTISGSTVTFQTITFSLNSLTKPIFTITSGQLSLTSITVTPSSSYNPKGTNEVLSHV